jgi:hypothetical protein
MAPKAHAPSAEALANAAERSDGALLHAQTFVAQAFEDSKNMARELVNELLVQLLHHVEFAISAGHTGDHYQMAHHALHHISYCLALTGPGCASCAAEALDVVWSDNCCDGCEGHVAFFRDAGLEALFLNCIRTIQDAIGMCMLRDGDVQTVLGNERLRMDTKSRLRNAFFMQKRYLKDVGRHLMNIGVESDADHTAARNARGPRSESSLLQRRDRAGRRSESTEP